MVRDIWRSIDESFESRILGPIEYWLWKFRYVSFLAVLFCAIAAVVLFIMGTLEIIHPIITVFHATVETGEHAIENEELLKSFIGAIDLYLIAVFFLIFSFGLYEIIISKIDVARVKGGEDHQLLQITSLDELKSKIIKVIIIILMVAFFKNVISMGVFSMIDAFLLSIAILAICLGSYYLSKSGH